MPYCVSKIQPHTTVAVSGGIAHASSSPTETTMRHDLLRRVISTATRMPRSMFSTVSTTIRPRLRISTAGKSDCGEQVDVVLEPDEVRQRALAPCS